MKPVTTMIRSLCLTGACVGPATLACADSLTETTFSNGATLKAYGQISEAWLNYDDGETQRDFAPVGNRNSSTRAGVIYDFATQGSVAIRFNGELEYIPRSSNSVNFADPYVNDYTLDRDNIRKVELRFATDKAGTFWIGQGSMASDTVAEKDLSGTTLTSYSSLTDSAGGFFFAQTDGTLSTVKVKSAYSNLDGSRRARIRYDTPAFAGVTLSAAYGQEVLADNDDRDYYDVGLHYKLQDSASFEAEAGLGYNWRRGDDAGDDREFYSGSASLLHKGTGLNITLAAGHDKDADTDFGFAKLGWKGDVFAFGSTALSVDYGRGEGFVSDDGELTSWAVAAVQKWDRANVEFYALYRVHAYDDDTANYQDGRAIFSGIRWRF
ncbi:MAG: porin [Rhodobacteraceae bacterium]|nr:porin [Paracoccaceae bacterium]